ncbi:SGNH/GDSL hydrolase family protein [Herbiconiux sp. KACC 21604]|uniref:SGNH/GDSL hydrolase family protein n=1 Tax=unclassified Herbiconiux TaxID=2618217 RepID=UPI0020A26946|nr:SGNH/GDSL hydrolase family protein [Herbiconiux sp. SALV-R1]WPO85706.1 SGNH/GDSL hydrolase family protein [Herbiconiux sp. KACC 21604]
MRKPLILVVLVAVAAAAAVLVAIAFAAIAPTPTLRADTGTAAGSGPQSGPSTAPLDPNAPVVAFYGDSYTLGTGASDPALRWSSVISAERGWNEFNPSVNGLGFVNNRASTPPDYSASDEVSQVIAADPDIVFITMGLNDNFSMPQRADDIRSAIRTDFSTLRTELPEARIVVVEPFWYTDARPDSVEQIIGWVHDEADAIGADYIAGASHWIEGHPEWMAADGLHPNDAGYAAMATRMNEELARLGL